MIISFAYTTPALLAGAKSCTRRDWDRWHAAKFHKGDLVDAYDKSPRFHGRKVATIQLAEDPSWEPFSMMPDSDYEAEGFYYLHEHQDEISKAGRRNFGTFGFNEFLDWKSQGGYAWVVRFRLISREEAS